MGEIRLEVGQWYREVGPDRIIRVEAEATLPAGDVIAIVCGHGAGRYILPSVVDDTCTVPVSEYQVAAHRLAVAAKGLRLSLPHSATPRGREDLLSLAGNARLRADEYLAFAARAELLASDRYLTDAELASLIE